MSVDDELEHGTVESADEYECRCMPCVMAWNDWAIGQNRELGWKAAGIDYGVDVVIVSGLQPLLVPTRNGWEFCDHTLVGVGEVRSSC